MMSTSRRGSPYRPLDGVRILLAEDDDMLRGCVQDYLAEEGGEVTAASDGIVAVKLGYQEPFDVVMSDFRMPGIDGLGVLRSLKILDPSPITILMTSFPGDQLRSDAQLLGVDRVLHKPFLLESLSLQLKELLIRNARVGVSPAGSEA